MMKKTNEMKKRIVGGGIAALVLLLAVTTTTTAYGQIILNNTNTTTTNATAAGGNVTNATAAGGGAARVVITELTYYNPVRVENETVPLPVQAVQFQSSDPTFAQLVQLLSQCVDFINRMHLKGGSGAMLISENQQLTTCNSLITQGVNQFCTFEALDVMKCNAAKEMTLGYGVFSSLLSR